MRTAAWRSAKGDAIDLASRELCYGALITRSVSTAPGSLAHEYSAATITRAQGRSDTPRVSSFKVVVNRWLAAGRSSLLRHQQERRVEELAQQGHVDRL